MFKKTILEFLLLAALTYVSFMAMSTIGHGANTPTFHNKIETIEDLQFKDFDMTPIRKGYSNLNSALLDEKKFLSKFGAPLRTTIEYAEMDEENMSHHVYQGAEAWFIKEWLQALIFTTPDYHFVRSNGISIKVGDPVSKIASMFPAEWQDRTDYQVFVGLQNSKVPVDMTLLFEFDSKKRTITSISIKQY